MFPLQHKWKKTKGGQFKKVYGYYVGKIWKDADVDERDIDPETGQILPDKYNYLKIENVFSGQLKDVDALFSLELALLTKQPSVSSDLFIAALFEIEAEVVAAITPSVLEVNRNDLVTPEGRAMLSDRIRETVNTWLETEKDMRPAITEVFIINLNHLLWQV